ncbi:MAG TPA: hypothetical protein VD997_10235 [Phycisphaerales bacterium]|nr:hypothetical protein [Phycisphaerales bacterium]
MSVQPLHRSDGSDEAGAGLTLSIRIGADGRLYFHDLTADLLPVAAALCPTDAELTRRLHAAEAFAGHEAGRDAQESP